MTKSSRSRMMKKRGTEKQGAQKGGDQKMKGGRQQMKGWQRKGGKQQNSSQAESRKIHITTTLDQFCTSQNDAYTFEANLSRHERAMVHELSRKMGMRSKSSGRGEQRRISVFKNQKHVNTKMEKQDLVYIKFSRDSELVLQDLFTHYPPEDSEVGDSIIGKYCSGTNKKRQKNDDFFCRPSMSKVEIAKKVEALASRMEKIPHLRQLTEVRSRLPIASFRDTITSTIESHQVVLVSGETGCGKTTQVPQYLLDYTWSKGKTCKVVCTQPRRISATSVAERISCERGENIGDTVGYKIRLESKGGRNSSISFCTNGILLRLLVSKGSCTSATDSLNKSAKDVLSEITHIVVDEIHERDRYSDFMLAILRDMLPSYPQLRLILMSATFDAERFSQYFGGCPVIRVPGFTYPVKSFFLEDVLTILKPEEDIHLAPASSCTPIEESELSEVYRIALDEAITLACTNDEFDPLVDLVSYGGAPNIFNYQHSSTGVTPLMVFAGKGRTGDVCMLLSFGANCHLQAKDGTTALVWAEQEKHLEVAELIRKHMESALSNPKEEQELLDKYLATINPQFIDVALIEKLLRKICSDEKDGAILIFLPGWDEINKTREKLLSSPFFSDSSKFVIMPLHSMVPADEQKKVFRRPSPGCRKIVLSTNIAETAVTIDDVVYVINSGRMKEKSYDPYNNVSTLQSSWVSKASARQREGRAGRCQPGICYHLYSKLRAESLPDFQVPEINRMPIEELCLQIKLLNPNIEIEAFLRKLLDVPVLQTIRNAITELQDIGALTFDEDLTELGRKLGSLPVQPATGKMLFFAILMSCLGPALTLASASDYRDPFTIPMLPSEKQTATAARAELASLYGGHSDQLSVVAAFDCWSNAKENGRESQFCSKYFISSGTMRMISRMRKQLQNELIRTGFIPEDVSSCSLNGKDPGILHAVLVAGLYPMVGKLRPLYRSGRKLVVETQNGDKPFLHRHSSNSKLSIKKSDNFPLLVFDEITRGDMGLQIRNCSVVGPLPLLLLATDIVVAPGKEDEVEDEHDSADSSNEGDKKEQEMNGDIKSSDQHGEKIKSSPDRTVTVGEKIMSSPDKTVTVIIDQWLPFKSTALDVAQVYCLRERLSAAVLFRVTNPREVLPPVLGASVFAIACILSYDGLSGISVPKGSVDLLTSKVNATEIGQSVTGRGGMGKNLYSFLTTLNLNVAPSFNFQPPKFKEKNGELNHSVKQPPSLAGKGKNGKLNRSMQRSPSLAGCGGGTVGPYSPRGDSFKRQRGGGSK